MDMHILFININGSNDSMFGKIPQSIKRYNKKWTGVLEVKQQNQIADHTIKMTLQTLRIMIISRRSFGTKTVYLIVENSLKSNP